MRTFRFSGGDKFTETFNCAAFLLSRLESSTHNTAHNDAPFTLSSNAVIGMTNRAQKRKSERRDASAANAGEAIPGLLNDIVVTHVLRSEYFDDPADLARLPAVSRAMRDTMAGTGLQFEELDEYDAVELGCVSAVQRMQQQGPLSRQERLCQAAARSGQLEELKLLRADGCPWDKDTCWAAAEGGHLEVLQWARKNGCLWDWPTCRAAEMGGHLEVLQWALANGCSCDQKGTCNSAASGGHLGVLIWLRSIGCEWDQWNAAAKGGYLDLLQWALANGCPWSEYTCSGAAGGGHLEILQWLRANDCPWGTSTCHDAVERGHVDVLQWTRANGCPWGTSTCHDAAERGHVEVRGKGWTPRGAAVGLCKRQPVTLKHVLGGGEGRAP